MNNTMIGILTHPLRGNYGGIMQAWALQQVIKSLGYEPQTIDWEFLPTWKSYFRGLPGAIRAKLFGRNVNWPPNPITYPVECRGLRDFVKRNLSLSSRIDFSEILPFINKNYRTVIVGSDQVWRRIYFQNIQVMFLPYPKVAKGKKIAYAASFGTDDWEYSEEDTIICAKLLSDFDAVSVREKSGLTLCRSKLRYTNCYWVLDPTLLINKSDYDVLSANEVKKGEAYVFAYILDKNPNLISIAQSVATELKLPLKIVSIDENVKPSDTIESWLASFRDAKYIITDSFHGTVFSLIYNKEFAVFKNQARGNARFDNLIELFPQIKTRIIVDNQLPDSIIDWTTIENQRNHYKTQSINFIKEALLHS